MERQLDQRTVLVIDRSTDNQVYTELVTLPANITSYTDPILQRSFTYYYRVRAGESLNSNYQLAKVPGHDPFAIIQAESLDAQSGLTVSSVIGSCDNGDWVKYGSLDFGAGATNIRLLVANGQTLTNLYLEVRLDSTVGTRIANINILGTGGWGAWTNLTVALTNVTGLHDLYFAFKGGSGVGNMDYFSFAPLSPGTLPQVPPVPQGVAVEPVVPSSVLVKWAVTNGQSGFKVERSTDNQNFMEIGMVSSNSYAFTDAGLPGGTTYYYRVRSYNAQGLSDYSASVATTSLAVPGTPPNFPPGGINLLPGGGILLLATGAINAPYRLWIAMNVAVPMNNWTVLVSSTISASPFTNIDLTATNQPQRFYRFSNP